MICSHRMSYRDVIRFSCFRAQNLYEEVGGNAAKNCMILSILGEQTHFMGCMGSTQHHMQWVCNASVNRLAWVSGDNHSEMSLMLLITSIPFLPTDENVILRHITEPNSCFLPSEINKQPSWFYIFVITLQFRWLLIFQSGDHLILILCVGLHILIISLQIIDGSV